MARDYMEHPEKYRSFSMEEYLEIMLPILEVLNPAFIVERIAGEVTPGAALKEGWGVRYDVVLKRFEEMLPEVDSLFSVILLFWNLNRKTLPCLSAKGTAFYHTVKCKKCGY